MKDITVTLDGFLLSDFENALRSHNEDSQIFKEIKVERSNKHGLTITPEAATIIVAGVNSLTLLINAFLVFIVKRKKGVIKIVTQRGDTIEIPESIPPNKLREYLDNIEISMIRKIIISK